MSNRYLRLITFSAISAGFLCEPSTAQPLTKYRIDFEKFEPYQAVFESGLRPVRVPGLENSMCNIHNTEVMIVLPDGHRFELPVRSGDVSLCAGNLIPSIVIICPNQGLEVAARLTYQMCAGLEASTQGLEKVLHRFRTNPDDDALESVNNWRGYVTQGGVNVSITLQGIHVLTKVLMRVRVSLHWNLSPMQMLPLMEPIQPPAGFERVSMEPPGETEASPEPGGAQQFIATAKPAALLAQTAFRISLDSIRRWPVWSRWLTLALVLTPLSLWLLKRRQ